MKKIITTPNQKTGSSILITSSAERLVCLVGSGIGVLQMQLISSEIGWLQEIIFRYCERSIKPALAIDGSVFEFLKNL